MKAVKIVLKVLVVIVAVALLAAMFFAGPMIKTAVETAGPALVGVPITLESARLSIFAGEASLKGLVVGNPEGFKSDHAFKLGNVAVKIDMASIFSKCIVIESILIDGPDISYELAGSGSNIGKIMENLEKGGGAKEEPRKEEEKPVEKEAPAPEKKAPGKKVQINDFTISNARVSVRAALLGGHGLVIPLPPIHLKDIGKESEGATVGEVISKVFSAIMDAVTKAVAASGQLLGKGVEALGGAAGKGIEMAGDAAGKGVEALGNAAGKGVQAVGNVAGKGVQAVGNVAGKSVDAVSGVVGAGAGAVGDAAKSVGGAVGHGASKLAGGVTGLFGKDKEESPTNEPPVVSTNEPPAVPAE